MNVGLIFVVASLLLGAECASAADAKGVQPPAPPSGPAGGALSPVEAAAILKLEKGLRIETVAAEPLTASPVAVAFDERGRMFVVEDRGYPVGPAPGQPPAGVIAILEDTDGDGIYDKRTVFAEGLSFPNGIACWRGGVFVTCAPDIYYLKDTKGDGKADVRKVVLTGFNATTTTQLRVSHPTLGLDGWIYLTSGLTGGKVQSPEHPERPVVEFTKSDSRFNPDTYEFETVAGAGQFGLTFDDFGRKFVCSNRNPLQHTVIAPRYLKRNPYLAFSETVQDAAPFGDAGKVWPTSPDTTTASFMPVLMGAPHAGTFTSACGCLVYRGSLFGADHHGNAFVCEPAQNLVQRQVISPNGATFRSSVAHEGEDFLTSPDTWFRPVFATVGPEDALYICDMYRKVIDHPQYLPEAVRATADFDAGKEKGRIYRIVPESASAKKLSAARQPTIGKASGRELCAELNDPASWVRDTAFRLLLERKEKSSIGPLLAILRDPKSLPQARSAALRLLADFPALEPAVLQSALSDPSAGIREQAIQLAEPQLKYSAQLLAKVSQLAGDPDPRVRFQTALSLGEATDPRTLAVLAKIAGRDGGDRWTRAAVLSSIGHSADEFFGALKSVTGGSPEAMAAVMTDLGRIFGVSQPPEKCLALLSQIMAPVPGADTSWQPGAISGMAEGLRNRGIAKGGRSALMTLVSINTPAAQTVNDRLKSLFEQLSRTSQDSEAALRQRVAAITLLGQADYSAVGAALLGLVSPRQPTEIQIAAVRAYGQLSESTVGKALMSRERWRTYLPPVREAVLATIMSQPRQLPQLIEALENGDIQPWSLEPARRNQLMQNKDAAIKERALALFKNQGGADRQKVYEDYKSVAALPANGRNGHEVFKRICVQCHTYAGEGVAVGPDLTGVRNQPAEALLLHILIPSYEIVAGYTSYDIETKDGRNLTGLVASETETSVTLKRALGETETILRSNIATMNSASLSLMPDELEKTMTRQELADLIAYLKGR